MNKDMADVLDCVSGYIKQLGKMDREHAVEVPPGLTERLAKAAKEAEAELKGDACSTMSLGIGN